MSMTRADAKNYIARVLSAVQSQQAQIWAEESLQRAFTDFQLARNWEFLLKDTSGTRTIGTLSYSTSSKVVTPPQDISFEGLNIGQTLYAGVFTGGKNVIASIAYDPDTHLIVSFTLTNYPAASGASVTTTTDDIPINVGQTDYNLPPDMYAPSTTRILGSAGYKVEYIRNGTWYRAATSPDTNGVVDFYSLFNKYSPASTGNGMTKLRLRKPPAKADTLRIEYFRTFDRDSDPLDIPDDYLYKFLDYCRALILEVRRATEDPGAYSARAIAGLASSALADQEPVDDEDLGLISQMSVYSGNRTIWTNGPYNAEA